MVPALAPPSAHILGERQSIIHAVAEALTILFFEVLILLNLLEAFHSQVPCGRTHSRGHTLRQYKIDDRGEGAANTPHICCDESRIIHVTYSMAH